MIGPVLHHPRGGAVLSPAHLRDRFTFVTEVRLRGVVHVFQPVQEHLDGSMCRVHSGLGEHEELADRVVAVPEEPPHLVLGFLVEVPEEEAYASGQGLSVRGVPGVEEGGGGEVGAPGAAPRPYLVRGRRPVPVPLLHPSPVLTLPSLEELQGSPEPRVPPHADLREARELY